MTKWTMTVGGKRYWTIVKHVFAPSTLSVALSYNCFTHCHQTGKTNIIMRSQRYRVIWISTSRGYFFKLGNWQKGSIKDLKMLPRLNSSQLFERLLTLFSLFCCKCRFLLLTHFLYPCVTYLYLSLLFSALLRRWLSVHESHRCEEDTLLFPSAICSTSNVASASIICLS